MISRKDLKAKVLHWRKKESHFCQKNLTLNKSTNIKINGYSYKLINWPIVHRILNPASICAILGEKIPPSMSMKILLRRINRLSISFRLQSTVKEETLSARKSSKWKIIVNHKIRGKFNTLLRFKLDPTINLILHSVLITGCNLKSKIMATIMNLEIKRKNRICLKSRLRVRIEIHSRKKCTKSMLILKLKQHHLRKITWSIFRFHTTSQPSTSIKMQLSSQASSNLRYMMLQLVGPRQSSRGRRRESTMIILIRIQWYSKKCPRKPIYLAFSSAITSTDSTTRGTRSTRLILPINWRSIERKETIKLVKI